MKKPTAGEGSSRRTWIVVGLLFVIALVNYFDRQSLSVVVPRFQAELHLSDQGYAHIISLFLFASAVAYALAGFLSDWLGTRRSMALFVGWWSLAEAATAFATSTFHLGLARFCLGLGEPGLWVAAPKAVGEVVEEEKRGLAIGVYTMGATVGAVIALPTIHAITGHLPWRSIFLIDGCVGLLWLPFWFWSFNGRPKSPCDLQPSTAQPLAQDGNYKEASDLKAVLAKGSTWKLVLARGITDPVWYFYLFWFPKFLASARHLSQTQIAHVGWTVYLAAGVGTLAGGVVSGLLIARGISVGVAYRRTMLFAALLLPLSPLCPLLANDELAVAIACIVALAHMAWLVTLTATIVAIYPPHQVGKAAGLIAAGSGFGGMLSSELIGYLVTHGGYTPAFLGMAVLHPLAIVILWKVFLEHPSSAEMEDWLSC